MWATFAVFVKNNCHHAMYWWTDGNLFHFKLQFPSEKSHLHPNSPWKPVDGKSVRRPIFVPTHQGLYEGPPSVEKIMPGQQLSIASDLSEYGQLTAYGYYRITTTTLETKRQTNSGSDAPRATRTAFPPVWSNPIIVQFTPNGLKQIASKD
jgi:hypothetical protein